MIRSIAKIECAIMHCGLLLRPGLITRCAVLLISGLITCCVVLLSSDVIKYCAVLLRSGLIICAGLHAVQYYQDLVCDYMLCSITKIWYDSHCSIIKIWCDYTLCSFTKTWYDSHLL